MNKLHCAMVKVNLYLPTFQNHHWHFYFYIWIVFSEAAPLNLPNNQQMEKLLFIDPEIILQHVQGLVCIPQRHSSSSDITKHWIKLVATGNISKEDLLSIISSQSINAEKILNLMLAFGMIFKHFIDQDGIEQYLFPYFLSEQGHINYQRTDRDNACLYLQCVDQTHLSSMQFYQLAFSIRNQSDGNKISLTSANSCTLHHQGHEITLVHHKFQDRMQIIIGKWVDNFTSFCNCIYRNNQKNNR